MAVQQSATGCFDLAVTSRTYHYIILKASLRLFRSCLVDILILQRVGVTRSGHRKPSSSSEGAIILEQYFDCWVTVSVKD